MGHTKGTKWMEFTFSFLCTVQSTYDKYEQIHSSHNSQVEVYSTSIGFKAACSSLNL